MRGGDVRPHEGLAARRCRRGPGQSWWGRETLRRPWRGRWFLLPLLQTPVGEAAAKHALRILDGEDASKFPLPPVPFHPTHVRLRTLATLMSEDRLPGWKRSTLSANPHCGKTTASRSSGPLRSFFSGRADRLAADRVSRPPGRGAGIAPAAAGSHSPEPTATASALSASIAHELNQPLGAILSYAEAAELYLKADPPNLERVEQILANIRRDRSACCRNHQALPRVNERKDAVELEEFDINDVVRRRFTFSNPRHRSEAWCSVSTRPRAPSGPGRSHSIAAGHPKSRGERNGRHAELRCRRRRMSIQTALVRKSEVEVQVDNSGTGIPADKLKQVFDTFYTTKRMGTGLGLSISRAIVETYGGRIWAENLPGGGAAFRFTLPLSRGASA